MNIQRFVCYILQPHVLPLMAGHLRAIFQQDNARSYTTRVSQGSLCHISTFPWPDQSPHLSTTENIWNNLGRQVGQRISLFELEARLQQLRN
ncbi:hypothetical protein TNCV_1773621 [Trichonephila clavipes]|nr:hypothetical protein TNCV_1773621 [Trichonephila clavipes]